MGRALCVVCMYVFSSSFLSTVALMTFSGSSQVLHSSFIHLKILLPASARDELLLPGRATPFHQVPLASASKSGGITDVHPRARLVCLFFQIRRCRKAVTRPAWPAPYCSAPVSGRQTWPVAW